MQHFLKYTRPFNVHPFPIYPPGKRPQDLVHLSLEIISGHGYDRVLRRIDDDVWAAPRLFLLPICFYDDIWPCWRIILRSINRYGSTERTMHRYNTPEPLNSCHVETTTHIKGLGICSMFLFSFERAFVFESVNVWPCVAHYFKSNLLIVKPLDHCTNRTSVPPF